MVEGTAKLRRRGRGLVGFMSADRVCVNQTGRLRKRLGKYTIFHHQNKKARDQVVILRQEDTRSISSWGYRQKQTGRCSMRLKQDHSDVTFTGFVSFRSSITAATKGA